MPEIINRNADIQDKAKDAFALTSEQLTKVVSDRIQPIVDLTPDVASKSVKVTDGTETAAVTAGNELAVANYGYARGASGQTALSQYASTSASWTQDTYVNVHSFTTTTGKTTYITGINISIYNSGSYASIGGHVRLTVGGTQVFATVISQSPHSSGNNPSNMTSVTFPTPIAVAASTAVAVQYANAMAAATTGLFARVFGWEE